MIKSPLYLGLHRLVLTTCDPVHRLTVFSLSRLRPPHLRRKRLERPKHMPEHPFRNQGQNRNNSMYLSADGRNRWTAINRRAVSYFIEAAGSIKRKSGQGDPACR